MNKKMRELRAQIEVLNEEATNLFNAKDLIGAENKLTEIDNLEREFKVAEKLFKGEKEEVTETVVNKMNTKDKVASFVSAIKKVANSMNETNGTDGGYTVPEDIQTDIEHFRESKRSLQDLITVETVTTMSGRRTYKKRSQMSGFSEVGEGKKIGKKETPKFDIMKYNIKKYAGIYPVMNELFEDSDANIYQELISWIADESRVTRNKLILDVIKKKTPEELNGLDDIKRILNVTLGQAFKPTSKIVTNDDGLQYLDTIKDSDGNYILQSNPADPMKLVLCAGANTIPLEIFPNSDMPSDGAKIPLVIGDLKEGIKMFDRKKTNITTSNVAIVGSGDEALNAFEEDLTLFRGIEREDVVSRDEEAYVYAYINGTTSISEEPVA